MLRTVADLERGYRRQQLAVIIRWIVIGVLMIQVIALGSRVDELERDYRQHIEALDRACAERNLDCDG